ncbi:MAG TPA: N-acetyl-gamma-glutamyl-phosphate reductase [Gemmatimonadota bacterium]|nr:N-acetyl-gamma-glutamyl-phosphate reductase [Gemmatimonadota bacterium]
MNVAVIGAAGFVGGELLRILLGHPGVERILPTSRSQAARAVADVHPGLAAVADAHPGLEATFADLGPAEAARGADVVFLALEHGASSRVMADVLDAAPGLVIDLAADFRVADPALREPFYGPHAAPELADRFVYALADVAGEALAGERALAVPGCFATAAQLALWPLAGAPLAAPPALFAITGSSGGGRAPRDAAHHPLRAHNVFAYGVLGHRHQAEVTERWRSWTGADDGPEPRLLVHAGPFVRGIYLTLHARLAGDANTAAAGYAEAWAGRPFVRVLEAPPDLTPAIGTNTAFLHAAAAGGELQVSVAIDNLVKGAAGQAVQAMNLALGLPETKGLLLAGPWPC